MNKISALIIALIAAVAIIGTAACSDAELSLPEGASINSSQNVVSVSGEGKVYVAPDLATLNLGVEARADTVDEARAQAADAMGKVMQALENSGIDEKDIQTSRFTIYPVTKWDRETEEEIRAGFRVTNMITAKIREIENTSSVIDDAVKAGGDLIQVQDINFSIEDPAPYQDEAREKAVAAAKAKADQLANLAEVELGKPTQISESGGYYPIIRTAGSMALESVNDDSATSISIGEQEVTITVQISYAIK